MTSFTPISAAIEVNKYSTIFCNLFSRKENLQKLYQELHPEQSINLDEIDLIDLRSDISETVSSFLGFWAKDKLIVVYQTAVADRIQQKSALTGFFFDLFSLMIIDPDFVFPSTHLLQNTEFYILYTGPDEKENLIQNGTHFLKDPVSWFKINYSIIDTSNPETITGHYYQLSHYLQNWPENREGSSDIAMSAYIHCVNNNILKEYFLQNLSITNNIIRNVAAQLGIIKYLTKKAREESKIQSREELRRKLLEGQIVSQEQISSFFLSDDEKQ